MRMPTLSRNLFGLLALLAASSFLCGAGKADKEELQPRFHTSDRCLACHNGITTPKGRDISFGFDWRASIMGNSSRDPYWQASVRREDFDHPQSVADIEDGCADCHMPMARYEAKLHGRKGRVFSHLPFDAHPKKNALAEDGVSCSLCHQISKQKLGAHDSFNGGFVIETPSVKDDHPEFGPYSVPEPRAHIMQTSTGGFRPTESLHIGESALCATCHTLYTTSLGPGGKVLGKFPEQVPYQEWLHSDYAGRQSCQSCHMPDVGEDVPIVSVLGVPRRGVRQHTFTGGNFFILRMLNLYRTDLSVGAMPLELDAEARRTMGFLQSQAAKVTIRNVDLNSGKLAVDVFVENRTGHKLPTAFPSRRAWLHFVVRDHQGSVIFESGKLNPDGSIQGNVNDLNPLAYEPHFRTITSGDQVEIFEPILGDENGHVTTGLADAVGYLKDDRLLPYGFDKNSAEKDIAVMGDAASDPNFTGAGALVRYIVNTTAAQGPFQLEAELWYQPIGFRWAHNLRPYQAMETQRFVHYYESMPQARSIVLARAEATR